MKYELRYYPTGIGYEQVEEGVYEERDIPEIILVRIIDASNEEQKQIKEYCDLYHIHHISNLIYFDHMNDRLQFLLTFG
jgi:hypothetical protein